MAISKSERYEQESAIFQYRTEAGLQKLREWLFTRRDVINDKWMELEGDELIRWQGEAKLIKRQIKLLDQGPTIKETEQ